jgi:hypothetical protein
MPILGEKNAMADGETSAQPKAASRRSLQLRATLRALHRDAGYLAVGLTVVYALSGLAVNHIADWDPSFDDYEHTYQLTAPLRGDDAAIAREVLGRLGIREAPRDVYRSTEDQLDLTFDKRTLHVTPSSGHVLEQGQKERLFFRAANYLHLNRGKKAWTYAADTYAAALLFLALSGMFMIKGRKGLFGRGLVLVTLGATVPVLYVLLS